MSANLTVYSMAIAAEGPHRMRAAEQAYLAAQADAASGQRFGRLMRRIGSALLQHSISDRFAIRSPIMSVGRGESVGAEQFDRLLNQAC